MIKQIQGIYGWFFLEINQLQYLHQSLSLANVASLANEAMQKSRLSDFK